jgi:hypothetical protein
VAWVAGGAGEDCDRLSMIGSEARGSARSGRRALRTRRLRSRRFLQLLVGLQLNIPKILTGTAVGVQTADNQPVVDVDLTDTFINAPVRTISGKQAVAIQLIDQSPIAFDDLVFRDLVAAHAAQTDQQVIGGTGANGQVLGIQLTPGITTIAVSAIDIQHVYGAIANAVQTIHTTRFLPPEVIVMHPRRWGWFLSLLDASDRPLFLGTANAPMNVAGVLTDVASQQIVGSMHGTAYRWSPTRTSQLPRARATTRTRCSC